MVESSSAANFEITFSNETPVVKLPTRLSVLEAVDFKKIVSSFCKGVWFPSESS